MASRWGQVSREGQRWEEDVRGEWVVWGSEGGGKVRAAAKGGVGLRGGGG